MNSLKDKPSETRSRKTRLIFYCVFMLLFLTPICTFSDNAPFPDFSIESYQGTNINKKSLEELGITVIIYGTPDSLAENRTELDAVLEKFRQEKKGEELLYTVNFKSYPGFIRGIIKGQMKKHSQEMEISIYADWAGILLELLSLDDSKVYFFFLNEKQEIIEQVIFQDKEYILSKIG